MACFIVPMLQLNAKLGAAAGAPELLPAPYEWTGKLGDVVNAHLQLGNL